MSRINAYKPIKTTTLFNQMSSMTSRAKKEKDESVDRLKSKLDDAYGKQDDLKSKYLRAVADLENLRKRSIRDREDAVQERVSDYFGPSPRY